MIRRLVLGLFLALMAIQIEAHVQAKEKVVLLTSEPGSSGVMAQLLAVAKAQDLSSTGVRGGSSSERPLGQYLVKPFQEFSSQYTKESVEAMCEFSYALHRFVAAKERDYDSFCLNRTKSKPSSAFVSAAEQRDFARSWWSKRKSFSKLNEAQKDNFLEEAVVDATNLYGWYARRVYGTAAYVAWSEGAVRSLLEKPYRSCN